MKESIIEKAKTFAIEKHVGQMYGKNIPYTHHLKEVARRVEHAGYGEVHIAVAWLHDVIEDTDVKYDDIENVFGKEVATPLLFISKLPFEKYFDYINRVMDNKIAHIVKIFDVYSNWANCAPIDSKYERYKKAYLLLTKNI